MDWNALKDQAANLSLYDVKAYVRKAQATVMNYSEIEQKTREATNNEPWGASTTLMNEIAQATHNYQQLNEIMPLIYSRFTNKSQEEWRQIYKALQLLQYLVLNGSERIVDDARSHLTLLKMLRQFHFIDPATGKDQGINVRNRSKELVELLGDVERIRSERKKARTTKNKYGGVEGGAGLGGSMSSSSRYGGFGSESGGYGAEFGGATSAVYGDGGGFGGQTSDFQDSGSRGDRFEEYDEHEEGASPAASRRQADTSRAPAARRAAAKKPEAPKKKEPEVDLFSFDEPVTTSSATGSAPTAAADDDDFDDFQSAAPVPAPLQKPATTSTTTSSTHFAAPQPVSAPKAANLSDLTAFSSISPAPSAQATPANFSAFSPPPVSQPARPVAYQGSQPNYFTSVPAPSSQPASSITSPLAASAAKPAPAKSSGDAFGSLWSTASVGTKKTSTPSQGPALGQLAKEKASAGIWGAPSSASNVMTHPTQQGSSSSVAGNTGKEPKWMDDLLG